MMNLENKDEVLMKARYDLLKSKMMTEKDIALLIKYFRKGMSIPEIAGLIELEEELVQEIKDYANTVDSKFDEDKAKAIYKHFFKDSMDDEIDKRYSVLFEEL